MKGVESEERILHFSSEKLSQLMLGARFGDNIKIDF
jgi:hypothetical protein